MGLLNLLGLDAEKVTIDWDMTPADTYGLFECRGDMNRVRSKNERYYYFYIDNWHKPARLCFMERGIRYARVLAYIRAPMELIGSCVSKQGTTYKEHSYAIDAALQQWLQDNVIESDDNQFIIPVEAETDRHQVVDLPEIDFGFQLPAREVRKNPAVISEKDIAGIACDGGFFESIYNPTGRFINYFILGDDQKTVVDLHTEITWQLGGSEHTSIRKTKRWLEGLNGAALGGRNDWRLPTIEEALSLLEPEKNEKGLHLAECFSPTQTYIFTADRRVPGGFWLVDFGQARVYWAAGSCFSGGFVRACRSEIEE